jgi:hypothetical protein
MERATIYLKRIEEQDRDRKRRELIEKEIVN